MVKVKCKDCDWWNDVSVTEMPRWCPECGGDVVRASEAKDIDPDNVKSDNPDRWKNDPDGDGADGSVDTKDAGTDEYFGEPAVMPAKDTVATFLTTLYDEHGHAIDSETTGFEVNGTTMTMRTPVVFDVESSAETAEEVGIQDQGMELARTPVHHPVDLENVDSVTVEDMEVELV